MRRYLLVLGIIALSACATPYKQMGLGGGVEEMQISEDTYRVRARGNGYTRPDRIEDFILLRSAEIAASKGYPYFAIISAADQTTSSSFVSPGYAQTNTTASATGTGIATGGGNSAIVTGTAIGSSTSSTTYTPPTLQTITRPGSQAVVKLLQSRDGVVGTVYDAAMVKASLGPKLQ
jgi:hypothetical protein